MIQYYGSKLRFIAHSFPLPYHTWAFVANQGMFVVDKVALSELRLASTEFLAAVLLQYNKSAIWNYIDLVFTNQEAYWNAATATIGQNQGALFFAFLFVVSARADSSAHSHGELGGAG